MFMSTACVLLSGQVLLSAGGSASRPGQGHCGEPRAARPPPSAARPVGVGPSSHSCGWMRPPCFPEPGGVRKGPGTGRRGLARPGVVSLVSWEVSGAGRLPAGPRACRTGSDRGTSVPSLRQVSARKRGTLLAAVPSEGDGRGSRAETWAPPRAASAVHSP